MTIGKPGPGGLGSRIAGWGQALLHSVSDVVIILRREGITGGILEVLSGRKEVFEGLARRGQIDALPNTKRPGANLYVQTDLQLSRAMKADFEITFYGPGDPAAQTYTRSMLYDRDRSKGALTREFERRLSDDMARAGPDSELYNVTIVQIDFVGLQSRRDTDYEWEPDDAPW